MFEPIKPSAITLEELFPEASDELKLFELQAELVTKNEDLKNSKKLTKYLLKEIDTFENLESEIENVEIELAEEQETRLALADEKTKSDILLEELEVKLLEKDIKYQKQISECELKLQKSSDTLLETQKTYQETIHKLTTELELKDEKIKVLSEHFQKDKDKLMEAFFKQQEALTNQLQNKKTDKKGKWSWLV